MELLLERGAAVNSQVTGLWTPLHVIVSEGHQACMQLLLECGANVHAATTHGVLPLHIAAANGSHVSARRLLEHGTAVDSRNAAGITPLQLAAFEGHCEVVFELLWRGADTTAATYRDGRPYAIIAAWRRGELREWRREVHALLPAAFRADVAAVLLATFGRPAVAGGAGSSRRLRPRSIPGGEAAQRARDASSAHIPPPAENPLRMLQSHHMLEPLFNALLIAHMGGRPVLPRAAQQLPS